MTVPINWYRRRTCWELVSFSWNKLIIANLNNDAGRLTFFSQLMPIPKTLCPQIYA